MLFRSSSLNYLLQNQINSIAPGFNRFGTPHTDYLRNYDYGISGLAYTSDMNQLTGSIAVYALNFAQPAGDYMKFRNKINEKNISLENVVLNRFQINGTIKVKNVSFSKQVFVRCSFNNWSSHEDFQAVYVPVECYSGNNSSLTSPTASSLSATFYAQNTSSYQPKHHKEFDSFRFEFQLPKTAPTLHNDPNNINASIQFCVCYRNGSEEYWDNNEGKNYEVLQYVIDVEKLKPGSSQSRRASVSSSASSSSSSSTVKSGTTTTSNYFKFNETSVSYTSASILGTNEVYY